MNNNEKKIGGGSGKTLAFAVCSFFVAVASIAVMCFGSMADAKKSADYKQIVKSLLAAFRTQRPNMPPESDIFITEAQDTAFPDWKAVVVYFKRGRVKSPGVFYVTADGKFAVAGDVYSGNQRIFQKQLGQEYEKLTFKLAEKDRLVINPSGAKTVFLFSDPDCPSCKQLDAALKTYGGAYRIVVKSFPLPMHHDAKTHAVANDKSRLIRDKGLSDEAAQKEAERMVDEDMAEGAKAEVPGTPTLMAPDGAPVEIATIFGRPVR